MTCVNDALGECDTLPHGHVRSGVPSVVLEAVNALTCADDARTRVNRAVLLRQIPP